MTYTISRAEQVLQTQRQALNLRWYPHYHRRPAPGGSTTQTVWCGSTAGTMPFINITRTPPSGDRCTGGTRAVRIWCTGSIAGGPGAGGPEDKDGCFSGSAVVDGDTLALIYTGHKFHGDPGDEANLYQVQCLATSRDGIHFERQGMVVDTPPGMHHFRDPKVWRRRQLVHDRRRARRRYRPVRLYRSADLRQWQDAGCWMKRKAPWAICGSARTSSPSTANAF